MRLYSFSMIRKSFSLNKSAFLWLAFFVWNITSIVGGAYAAVDESTVNTLMRSAQEYLDGKAGNQFLKELRGLFWKREFAHKDEAEIEELKQSLKGKLIVLKSNDGTGDTLVHKLIKDLIKNGPTGILGHNISGGYTCEGLYGLIVIEGIEALDVKNARSETPSLQGFPLDVKLKFLKSLKEKFPMEFFSYFETHQLSSLRLEVAALAESIDALKRTHPDEIKNRRSVEAREVESKTRQLSAIIRIYPIILVGHKLENFEDFFGEFSDIPEIRPMLRNYRTSGGKSLLEYYAERFLIDGRDISKPFQGVITSYLKDDIPITGELLDITVSGEDFYTLISSCYGDMDPEKFKQFLLGYRNKKNENFVQVIARGDGLLVENTLKVIQRKINDDLQFRRLLTEAEPGTKSADVMLMGTKEGRKFLTEFDPQYSVKADSYGITPVMRDALEMESKDFAPHLASLRDKGVFVDETQEDSFGNTIQLLQDFNNQYGSWSALYWLR
jgi:hypothetical protein